MAEKLDVSKGTLSALAARNRPGARSRPVFCSYGLSEAIREYVEAEGYRIDTADMLRPHERGAP